MAGLAYAQQQQVIAHTGFGQHAVHIFSIIRKLLYCVLGIVVGVLAAMEREKGKKGPLAFASGRRSA